MLKKNILGIAAAIGLGAMATASHAAIQLTEFMYDGANGEFFEFANLGASPIDMTGWSYDDDSAIAGTFKFLDAIGIVQPGEVIILAETSAEAFRTAWNLSPSLKIVGDIAPNFGRADVMNLYDASDNLVLTFAYGDQVYADTVRTTGASASTPFHLLGATEITTDWVLSTVGDAYGSYTSTGGSIGNPGTYVPEPSSLALLGLVGMLGLRRRR